MKNRQKLKKEAQNIIEEFSKELDSNTSNYLRLDSLLSQAQEELDALKLSSTIQANYVSKLTQLGMDKKLERIDVQKETLGALIERGKANLYSWMTKHPKITLTAAAFATATVTLFPKIASYAQESENDSSIQIRSENFYIGGKNEESLPVEEIQSEANEELNVPEVLLAPDLSFDANDNTILINNSIEFIASSRECGVDFMSTVGIHNYMDFYLLANMEQVDPLDYARLGYFSKTTDSIIQNFYWCINEFMEDAMTVTSDKQLKYDLIFSHQPSAELVMQFQALIAKYNDAEKSERKEVAKEIEVFIEEKLMNEHTAQYNAAAVVLCGCLAKSADVILPKGLSDDIMNFVGQDLYTCTTEAPYGTKQKSERAEFETVLYGMLSEKLTLSYMLEYRNQDFSLVSEVERLSGIQLETEIYKGAQDKKTEYQENEKFSYEGTGSTKKTSTEVSIDDVTTLPNNQIVSNQELEQLGLSTESITTEEYEAAKREEFEDAANNQFDANSKSKLEYAQSAFWDGLNGVAAKYPNDALYMKNYNEGVLSRPSQQETVETIVVVPEQIVEETTDPVVEQDFVEEVSQENSKQEEVETNPDSSSTEDYEIIIEESIEEEGFQEDYEIIEESVEEQGFQEGDYSAMSKASLLTQYKALRQIADTAIMNPVYNVEQGIFTLDGEEYKVLEKSRCA